VEPAPAEHAPTAGPRGRFVVLRRRRRQPEPEVETPAVSEAVSQVAGEDAAPAS
jgi:hypothetical protein